MAANTGVEQTVTRVRGQVVSALRSSRAIATVAGCPTLICAMSLSTTSAVTSSPDESMTIASPEGASSPTVMFTAVTTPSIGVFRVAFRSCARSVSRFAWALATWLWAL